MRFLVGAVCLALIAGCTSAIGEEAEESADGVIAAPEVDEVAELAKVLGDDRVGRALRDRPTTVPANLLDFELLLGIGRGCVRTDSREVYVVEEPSTRIGGVQRETEGLLPRAVIGGCNAAPTAGDPLRHAFELFAAVVSDTTQPANDPLSTSPVELMALDETTGLYNFYIFHKSEKPGVGARVVRFVRRADDVVEKLEKVPGQRATREVTKNRECYNCHVHGGPLMNELTEPWAGWVSTVRNYSTNAIAGESRALVSEARALAGEHGRRSIANELEQVTKAAVSRWVEGLPGRPGTGLVQQTLAGKQPGGVAELLRSVFCETELNFASGFETIPHELFVEPTAAAIAGLQKPAAFLHSSFPALLPVRSLADRRIETYLMKRGLLQRDTVTAVRLVDDERDVFSKTRCDLHAGAAERLETAASVDDAVRATVLDWLESGATDDRPARKTLIHALVDDARDIGAIKGAEAAYVAEITALYNADVQKLRTTAGMTELTARLGARHDAARAMFPTDAHPLPMLHRAR